MLRRYKGFGRANALQRPSEVSRIFLAKALQVYRNCLAKALSVIDGLRLCRGLSFQHLSTPSVNPKHYTLNPKTLNP